MLFAILSAVLFALMYVMVRRGQARGSPDGGLLLTLAMTAIALTALVAALWWLDLHPPLNAAGLAIFVVAGLSTTFLGRAFQFAALKRIGPARSTSYRITSPVVTLVLAVVLLGESIGTGPLLGILVAAGGLWMLTRAGVHDALPESRVGVALSLASAMSFGTGHALRKFGMVLIPSPYLGAWIGSLVAVVAQSIQLASKGQFRQSLAMSLRPVEWNLVCAGVLSTGAMLSLYVSFYFAPVSLASALASTEPLFSVVFTKWLLGDEAPLSMAALMGIAAIVAGVAIILLA